MNEEEIFHRALTLSLPEERAAYLQRACAGDPTLRASIEALLLANEGAGGFLDRPAPRLGPEVDSSIREGPGMVVGPYKLLERIGEGGMGVVFMAEQIEPLRRTVALKLIKPGMDTRQVIVRFEAERQALALMDHPNIARILDAGATESGRPYFAMEMVRGIPITEYCDRNRLSIDERLDLFSLVCLAVQHAHQQGIIHRDLKPSNVLISLHDDVPVPKVIDFGIAKAAGEQSLTDKTLYTGFADLIGTPMYLSPEQAAPSRIDIDRRSDVYSLGVLLYELLTGTTPFDRDVLRHAALDEVRRIIREEDPAPPSTRLSTPGESGSTLSAGRRADPRRLHHLLRRELDWITMKALEKDRTRRYDTAGALAADIARYRGHRPVEAGPPSTWYRGRKFARRHRRALAMAAIVVVSSSIVATGMWAWSAGRLDRARRDVEKFRAGDARRAVEESHRRYAAAIRQAHRFALNGRRPEALELLRKCRPRAGEEDNREFAWYYVMRLCRGERRSLRGHEGAVYHAGFSPDGRTLVSCGQDGTVRLWHVTDGEPIGTFRPPGRAVGVNWAEFSADARMLVSAGDDGQVRLWDVATRELRATIDAHAGEAYARFTPDGHRLVSVGRKDYRVKLWDLETRRLTASIKASDSVIENVVFSPDGETLATTGADEQVRLWNLADLTPVRSLAVPGGAIYGLAYSPDGSRIATGQDGGHLRVWDAARGESRDEFRGESHAVDIQSVAYLPGGRTIVTAGTDASLKFWDSVTGKCLGSLLGHMDKIWGVSVSPDGTTLATASTDGSIKLWDARPPQQQTSELEATPRGTKPGFALPSFTFSRDGKGVIVARILGQSVESPPGGVRRDLAAGDVEAGGFDLSTGTRSYRHRLKDRVRAIDVAMSHGGTRVLVVHPDETATTWDAASGRRLATIRGIYTVCWGSERNLVAKRPGGPTEWVDALSGRTTRLLPGSESALLLTSSPGGDMVVLLDGDQLILWDPASNHAVRSQRTGRPWWDVAAALSPDATVLALGDRGAGIQLWDPSTLERHGSPLLGHSGEIIGLSFSRDGRTLLSQSKDGTVKLWDVAAGEEMLTLSGPFQGAASRFRFTPDGRSLVFLLETQQKDSLCLLTTTLPEGDDPEQGP